MSNIINWAIAHNIKPFLALVLNPSMITAMQYHQSLAPQATNHQSSHRHSHVSRRSSWNLQSITPTCCRDRRVKITWFCTWKESLSDLNRFQRNVKRGMRWSYYIYKREDRREMYIRGILRGMIEGWQCTEHCPCKLMSLATESDRSDQQKWTQHSVADTKQILQVHPPQRDRGWRPHEALGWFAKGSG